MRKFLNKSCFLNMRRNNKVLRYVTVILLSLTGIVSSYSANSAGAAEKINCSTKECFKAALAKYSLTHSPAQEITNFEQLSKESNGMNGSCNDLGREMGYRLFEELGMGAFKYFSIECGHSVEYGIFEKYGKKSSSIDENFLKEYCLKDANPPSCTFGFGLAIAKYSMSKAYKSCETNFQAYDKSERKPESFQMSARGDCFNGFLSYYSNSVKPMSSVASIKKECRSIPSEYGSICTGILGYNYLNNSEKDYQVIRKKLKEIRNECTSKSSFECMQFVGKNTDQVLTYKLGISPRDSKNLKLYGELVNEICQGYNAKGCITGVIQSHIVHTSHVEMYSICNQLKEKTYCKATAKAHV